jgi:hypothetical protein
MPEDDGNVERLFGFSTALWERWKKAGSVEGDGESFLPP